MSDNWAPCRHIDYGEGMGDPRYGVMFDDFEATQELLESKGFEGGGYTWHGIVDAMIRTGYPQYADDLEYDPEGSMFCARSSNLDALRGVAKCIQTACADPGELQRALDNADPSIME